MMEGVSSRGVGEGGSRKRCPSTKWQKVKVVNSKELEVVVLPSRPLPAFIVSTNTACLIVRATIVPLNAG